jgi:hypothetical protein
MRIRELKSKIPANRAGRLLLVFDEVSRLAALVHAFLSASRIAARTTKRLGLGIH